MNNLSFVQQLVCHQIGDQCSPKGTKWSQLGVLPNSGLTTFTCSFNRTCLYLEIQVNIYPLQVSLDLQMRYANFIN